MWNCRIDNGENTKISLDMVIGLLSEIETKMEIAKQLSKTKKVKDNNEEDYDHEV